MSKTQEDLSAAFAGESQANRRYLAHAKKADKEGHPQAARMFRAAAAAETIHAHSHFRAMGGIKDTTENLKAAIAGENYEHTQMYPEFVEDAEKEGDKLALQSFTYAMKVEVTHERLFTDVLNNLGKGQEEFDYYLCPVCGHVHERGAPDNCPVCGLKGERFEKLS